MKRPELSEMQKKHGYTNALSYLSRAESEYMDWLEKRHELMLNLDETARKLIAGLEARAGVPLPCPECGESVVQQTAYDETRTQRKAIACRTCTYQTKHYVCVDDAYRAHNDACVDATCRAYQEKCQKAKEVEE